MKKFVMIFAFVAMAIVANAQAETVEIKTSAICGMCKSTIEKALAFEKGVEKSNLDVKTKIVTVQYDASKTTPDKIRQCIAKAGYNADDVKREEKAYTKLDDCCKDGGH
ncbi:MAG: heavy metal-associated domain-containing protein [Cyclobacteriaceae bacterium]|nr:heavy metal-associated domain-containing protein [Cyclobacteriaceae bacterium]